MAEHITTIIAVVVATIFSRMYYNKIKANGTKRQQFIENAKKHNHSTTGYYVEFRTIRGDLDSENYNRRQGKTNVKYEYYVDGNRYSKVLKFHNGGGYVADFPESVTVYYDPGKPEKALCQEQEPRAAQRQTGCLGAIMIWLIIAAVVLNTLNALMR